MALDNVYRQIHYFIDFQPDTTAAPERPDWDSIEPIEAFRIPRLGTERCPPRDQAAIKYAEGTTKCLF